MRIAIQIAVMVGYLLPLVSYALLSRRAMPALRPVRVPARHR